MAMASDLKLTDTLAPSAENVETRWYVVKICPNHEKRVLEHLRHREVEGYLPLCVSMRCWKDRRVQSEMHSSRATFL
jgi:hypothetical protein